MVKIQINSERLTPFGGIIFGSWSNLTPPWQVQLASANLAKSLKNSFFGVENPSFFLDLKFRADSRSNLQINFKPKTKKLSSHNKPCCWKIPRPQSIQPCSKQIMAIATFVPWLKISKFFEPTVNT